MKENKTNSISNKSEIGVTRELSNKNEIHQANSKIKFPENSCISPERDKDKILISNFYHCDNGPSDYTNTSTPKTSAPLNGSEEKLNSRYRCKYRDILAKKYNGQPELVNESNEATNNKIAENRYEYYSRPKFELNYQRKYGSICRESK